MSNQTRSISLDEALDLAVNKLGPLRERVMRRRLRNAEYRESVLDELALKLSACPDCASLGIQTVFSSSGFSAHTPFQINLDNLERFLQIIIQYLPTILDLVLKFLPLFIAVMAMLMIANTASGQCVNGVCQLPTRTPVINTFRIAASPVAGVIELQPVRTTARVVANTTGVVVRSVASFPQVIRNQVHYQQAIVQQRTQYNVRRFAPFRRLFGRNHCN